MNKKLKTESFTVISLYISYNNLIYKQVNKSELTNYSCALIFRVPIHFSFFKLITLFYHITY